MTSVLLCLQWVLFYIAPSALCFAIGALFCLIDFHRLVTKLSNGKAPMPYTRCASANLFFVLLGLISAFVLVLSDIYQSASDYRSVYLKAVSTGFLMPAAIRSKWFSHGNIKFGFEQAYDVFITWAVDNYKQKSAQEQERLSHILSRAAFGVHFEEDIVRFARRSIDHRDASYKKRFDRDVENLAGPDDDPQRYRAFLINLCMEYTSISAIQNYCRHRRS